MVPARVRQSIDYPTTLSLFRYNGVQKIFWCLVCDCDMKSLVSMDSHISGTKHHKKVVELKRVKEGLPPSNPIEKKKEKPKKPNHKYVSIHLLLQVVSWVRV